MTIERFEIPGLAQYAYIVSDGGDAAVIDPVRDFDRYLAYADRHGLRIVAILETHIHADFAAGSAALAEASGAQLCLSAYDQGERYEYAMPHRALAHGDTVSVGRLHLEAMHTPGHTPEHLSLLLRGEAGEPQALFSGDFLFAGSLGRPDLLGDAAKAGLAHALYCSLNQRLTGLPDAVRVYPGHGAGSFCGAGIGGDAETTLGHERAVNPFFRLSEPDFVAQILASVPPMPAYYPRMKQLNAQGAPSFLPLPGAEALTADRVAHAAQDASCVLLDLRTPEAFAAGHIAGAINIGSGSSLSLWAGWLLDPRQSIVLLTDGKGEEEDAAQETRRSLLRVGLDRIAGHLAGGMAAWLAAGRPVTFTRLLPPAGIPAGTLLLDVRNAAELHEGAIPGSRHVPLADLPGAVSDLPHTTPLVTVCAGGYRASIASSLLERAGFTSVGSLAGGLAAWRDAGLPTL